MLPLLTRILVLILLVSTTHSIRSNNNIDKSLKSDDRQLSNERLVFQTDYGDIHLAFYPEIAPTTVAHIIRLGALGAYNTVDFFRIDKGFVAQVSEITSARQIALDPMQKEEAEKHFGLEVHEAVQHDRRGLLSMARHDDPESNGSSFSIMLGAAPHLNMQYTIFGEVTEGMGTLAAMEGVATKQEGIFVMPLKRITIKSTYMYVIDDSGEGSIDMAQGYEGMHDRYEACAVDLQKEREKKLP